MTPAVTLIPEPWRLTLTDSPVSAARADASGVPGQTRNEYCAYDWLLSQSFAGRLLFLTGHAHAHPLVARAERLRRATVLDKPLDGRVLLDKIIGSSGGAEAI